MAQLKGGALYKNKGNAEFDTVQDNSWRSTWDIILSGNFSGQFSPIDEIFYYDAEAGLIRIYQVDASGKLKAPKTINNVSKKWDTIVSGSFRGQQKKELLFYNKNTGYYKFMELNSQGELYSFGDGRWKTGWDIILSFSYGGSYDCLAFYNKQTGNMKLFTTNGQGDLDATIYEKNVGTEWDTITKFTPYGASDSLFFYDAGEGKVKTFLVIYPDYYGFDQEFSVIKGCDIAVTGFFATEYPNLLLYNRESGTGKIYTYTGSLSELKEYEFPRTLHSIVPGNYFESPLWDLLIYGIHNKAIYLDWGGYVDTDFQFSEFFDNPHTIMAWFMPQFVHGYSGPIFAENGSGVYMVGQRNYDDGTGGGDPVFFIKVGTSEAKYVIPDLKTNIWHHLAVVRKGNDKFRLFVDGTARQPLSSTPEIQVGNTISQKPVGTLRFGRRTSIVVTPTTNLLASDTYERMGYQAYGFLDDVAVFGKALTGPEIEEIFRKRRLSGSEAGLIAFWPFDETVSNNESKIKSWKPSKSPARGTFPAISLVPVRSVSSSRSSDNDSHHFKSLFAINQQTLTLPFPVGETWFVSQGNNNYPSSHKATTAFAYDLVLADSSYNTVNSVNKEVYCSRTGKAVYYIKDGHCNKTCLGIVDCNAGCATEEDARWRNFVKIKIAEGEYVVYQHLGDNSLSSVITNQGIDDSSSAPSCTICIPDGYIIPEQDAPTIHVGDLIGKVGGPKCGPHLHIETLNTILKEDFLKTTIPVAFVNYEQCKENCTDPKNWSRISRGQPKQGYFIRRTQ